MENITTEELMDKLDMFQAIFGKVDGFCWWNMEIIQTEDETQIPPRSFSKVFLYMDYD